MIDRQTDICDSIVALETENAGFKSFEKKVLYFFHFVSRLDIDILIRLKILRILFSFHLPVSARVSPPSSPGHQDHHQSGFCLQPTSVYIHRRPHQRHDSGAKIHTETLSSHQQRLEIPYLIHADPNHLLQYFHPKIRSFSV